MGARSCVALQNIEGPWFFFCVRWEEFGAEESHDLALIWILTWITGCYIENRL